MGHSYPPPIEVPSLKIIVASSQPASQPARSSHACTQPMVETELPSYQAFLIASSSYWLAAPSSHVRNTTTNYRNTRSNKEDSQARRIP
jgi:hypothetical protein